MTIGFLCFFLGGGGGRSTWEGVAYVMILPTPLLMFTDAACSLHGGQCWLRNSQTLNLQIFKLSPLFPAQGSRRPLHQITPCKSQRISRGVRWGFRRAEGRGGGCWDVRGGFGI